MDSSRGGAALGAEEALPPDVVVLMLGRPGSGCTSLACSMEAARTRAYPKRHERKAGTFGGEAEISHFVPARSAGEPPIRLVDVQCPRQRGEVNLPGSRRLPMALCGTALVHDVVLFVLDGTARPIWDDLARAEDLGQLSATLLQRKYGVLFAVTKLHKAREDTLREVRLHGERCLQGSSQQEPRKCYEEYVSRYIEKVCVTIQATEAMRRWQATQDLGTGTFPRVGQTIFDIPTWTSRRDYEEWQERRGTAELPNLRYIEGQFEKLISAMVRRNPHRK